MNDTPPDKIPSQTGIMNSPTIQIDPDSLPAVLEFMKVDGRPSLRNSANELIKYGIRYAEETRGLSLDLPEPHPMSPGE